MKNFIHILYDVIVNSIVKIVGLTMLFAIICQVFTRTFFTYPFPWTDEVARFAFLWLCFLGSVMTLRYKLHLGIDYFVSKFSPKVRRINSMAIQGMVILFGFALLILGYNLLDIVGTQVSPILRLPMVIIYAVLPLAGALYVICGAYELGVLLKGETVDAPKLEEVDLKKEVQL
ncbi:MAG: TRAP transporter small permease [Elusimicrobiota bacterium]|jgi:TRAP-type C4-dicarboxylate transport system permease small subunit|nr:TRAP transporter small permease [Elusimicrobiota bacterium]